MELTPQEIQLFRHNGFIKFPTQLSTDHVESIKSGGVERYGGSRRTYCATKRQGHPNLRSLGTRRHLPRDYHL